jgi:predicted RNA polymerase sigma factor
VPSDVEDRCAAGAAGPSALTRRSGDFDAADDAVQEALIAAADHRPRDGSRPDPRGWLLRTAGPD